MEHKRANEGLADPPRHHQKTPSKEIGRQVFQLLRFFHDGIMTHTIAPKAPMDHRYH